MASATPTKARQRIAFVQYGDFLIDAERLGGGGPETYLAQRYSVEYVERLTQSHAGVLVVSLKTGPYQKSLPSGVHCIGMPNDLLSSADLRQLREFLKTWGPTTVVVRTPLRQLIADCLKANWRVFPILADSFRDASWRKTLSNWRLARLLNHPSIEFVANHQVPACQDLVRLGVDPAKVVPWDFPCELKPTDNPAKTGVRSAGQISVMYVGSVNENKGVGDFIKAVAQLNRSNTKVSATIVGQGDLDYFRGSAARLGVADRINFTGLIPHTQVVPMMQEHDVVVIPSRHKCPEGLPFTIYEALASRSPLVISDHPMFVKRLEDGRSALVFPQSDSTALADCLRRLIDNTELYARLSRNSADAWQRLRIPVLWGDLLDRWLAGGSENTRWLQSHSLTQYDYDGVRGGPNTSDAKNHPDETESVDALIDELDPGTRESALTGRPTPSSCPGP
jgi:glycosyltransferase involved in cell wall biosynthesis